MKKEGSVRVVMAQLSPRVGDIQGNAAQIIAAAHRARDESRADLVIFPEMALTGVPAGDVLLRERMPHAVNTALAGLRRDIHGVTAVVGCPLFANDTIYNGAVVLRDGSCLASHRKCRLSDDDGLDEHRYFSAGAQACVFEHAGAHVCVTIGAHSAAGEAAAQARAVGAQLLVNLAASPFCIGAHETRETGVRQSAADNALPICSVDCVGGQDDLVFDGRSFAVDSQGRVVTRAPAFVSGLHGIDWSPVDASVSAVAASPQIQTASSEDALVYDALVQATRDYVVGNGFPGVLLGASGGIDSALAMAIAADAIGGGHVHAVAMPSRYTADISNADAADQAARVGAHYDELSIESVFTSSLQTLAPVFGEMAIDVTEENMQARIRGMLLMALSNKFGSLLLATGNKSELAVGYSTLYGDMCGGFAPLKDVYKTRVYRLARYRNTLSAVIPERVIARPPSAELRAGQTDSDSLPDYPTLDAIIEAYVEAGDSIDRICQRGHDVATVKRIAALIRRNEYKRQQGAPGPAITARPFGRNRRFPITADWEAL